ncbi:MAG: pyruvate kinase [Saprospiraceae bacterium]|nr:pyruvate kinase [Saprospiraceae bacterium]MBP6568379.1 pyruvate kinase [Saprospiraceae bacterium]
MHVNHHQKTKILATIGPASSSKEALLDLVKAGVNVFRLNFSHGAHTQHQEVIDNILEINEKYHVHVGILADLQGPKLRIGKIENNALEINPGDILTFVNEECLGTKEKIYMSYELFASDVKVGEKVLVDDGKIVLEVISTNGTNEVKLMVLFGNILSSNKGVNLPDTIVTQPSLTEKDLEDLDYILTQPVNWIALSFVRQAKDVKDLQRRIKAKKHFAKVVAKVEKPEAIANIKEIIKASDAIMIARGDLGVEVPIEKLPGLQKMIIAKCIQKAKPVIVATQMMESMITNPSPSRAEVTDVANAVLDGTDAVMLSGETSVGNHPALVVEAMRRIIGEAEASYHMIGKRPNPDPDAETFLSDVLCLNAPRLAEEVNAKAILGLTVNGYTAFKISSYRPKPDIHIFSDKPHMLSTLSMVWGVKCYLYTKFTTTDETIEDVNEILKDEGVVETGDIVINTGSMPLHKRFRTNMLKITVIE